MCACVRARVTFILKASLRSRDACEGKRQWRGANNCNGVTGKMTGRGQIDKIIRDFVFFKVDNALALQDFLMFVQIFM